MLKNLVLLLFIVIFAPATQFKDAAAQPKTLSEAVTWLEKESHRLIRASKRTMKDGTAAFPPQVGIGYEAFWLRDYAYTLEGSIDSYSEKEHHIWGSVFAVYLGVADENQSRAIATYFRDHYSQIVQKGQIRHLPANTYWESCQAARDTYQNGAYWATPTGWFVYTLDLVDPKLADQTVIDLVTDFQKNGACEWVFGEKHQLPNYLASASLPLAGIRAMIENRKTDASSIIPATPND